MYQNLFHKIFLCSILLCCFQLVFSGSTASAQARRDTINIDFGNASRLSPGSWNNITNSQEGAIADLTNYQGLNSGISVAVTDAFNTGSNTAGAAADDTLRLPFNAASDSFFGSKRPAVGGGETTGGVTFSNMDPQTAYSFAIFASRPANDNRETQYTVTGKTTQVVSQVPSGQKAFFVRVKNMQPADNGTITITATTGANNDNPDGYYYLGAIRVTYLNSAGPGAKTLALTYPNGGEQWEAGKQVFIGWESVNIVSVNLEYSTDNGATWLPVATSVPAANKKYTWAVPATLTGQALVRITDSDDATITDVSNSTFTIRPDNGKDYRIVVLGSSTAAGTGPSAQDSAWVWRYTTYLTQKNTDFNVINLAVGGYTTSSILPSGNPEKNITKALSYNPDAIIINMPSNDAAGNVPVTTQMANYDQIAQLAAQANVPLWVTTTQPRNFNNDQNKIQIQLDMIPATRAKFGDNTIDFWTGFQDDSNQMHPLYNSGDGVHMNNLAHRIMFERVVAMNIDQAIIARNPLGTRMEKIIEYRIYPNPASGRINIAARDGSTIQKVTMFTTSGKKVMETELSHVAAHSLDATGLDHGLYLVRVQTAKGNYVSRIVLQ